MADDSAPSPSVRAGARSRNRRLLFRAPGRALSVGLILVVNLLTAAAFFADGRSVGSFLGIWIAVFLLPSFLTAGLTGPLAHLLGGRLSFRRSLLLVLTTSTIGLPLALLWRLAWQFDAAALPATAAGVVFLLGPALWMREMSLFGVSNPSHAGSLPPALLGPALTLVGLFLVVRPTGSLVVLAGSFLAIGFLAAAMLLRAADRPLRREFGVSGVSLIRPMLEHINDRDPQATERLEAFFSRFSAPADLRLLVVALLAGGRVKATVALPTVHPGPFGRLGASDLPARLAERLAPTGGLVLVPHTPCNHDQDLPSRREFDRLAAETRSVLDSLAAAVPSTGAPAAVSPLVGAHPGSLARVQLLGGVAITLITQAPAPTDDIDLAVVDPLVRGIESTGGPRMAVIDAHNSYVEDEGDLTYGTPRAAELVRDVERSLEAARAAARPGPVRAGVACREGFSLADDGIGPAGIRALVLEAAGTRTAYVLIDGNNLVVGARAKLLAALSGIVDAAEVMTTDNHIVHEVDGGTNPVGERIPLTELESAVRAVTEEAVRDLGEVEVRVGERPLPSIAVLTPGWTARLLTSLGDTVSMFSNAALMTFLLVVSSSVALLLAVR